MICLKKHQNKQQNISSKIQREKKTLMKIAWGKNAPLVQST